MKAKYGYLGMTADFLHIGHINAIKECKKYCERLMIGVMSDECVEEYKGKKPIMNIYQRIKLVESLKDVDGIFVQKTFNFGHDVLRLRELYGKDFIIFDSEEHARKNADILIPRTKGISSTIFKENNL